MPEQCKDNPMDVFILGVGNYGIVTKSMHRHTVKVCKFLFLRKKNHIRWSELRHEQEIMELIQRTMTSCFLKKHFMPCYGGNEVVNIQECFLPCIFEQYDFFFRRYSMKKSYCLQLPYLPLGTLETFLKHMIYHWIPQGIWTYEDAAIFCEVMIFQVIFMIATLQDRIPGFRHNDLKPDNIFLRMNTPCHDWKKEVIQKLAWDENVVSFYPSKNSCVSSDKYCWKDTHLYVVPRLGFNIVIGDFGLSECLERKNPYLMKYPKDFIIHGLGELIATDAKYYDLHSFIWSLMNHNLLHVLDHTAFQRILTLFRYIIPEWSKEEMKYKRCLRPHICHITSAELLRDAVGYFRTYII